MENGMADRGLITLTGDHPIWERCGRRRVWMWSIPSRFSVQGPVFIF